MDTHATSPSPVRRATAGTLTILRRLMRTPMGAAGLVIVAVVLFAGIFGDLIAPHDPIALNIRERLTSPSLTHILGTDQLGRDNFSRMLNGTQVALTVAFISISLSLVTGVIVGLAAGYGPRWLDQILIVLFDTVRSFPTLMFGIAIVALIGPSLETIITVIVITTFPIYARVVRTQTIAIKNNEFFLAERSIGVGSLRIVFTHVLPNILGQLLILASMDVPVVITIESGLSFLGLGIRPPEASWGTMLADGYAYIRNSPWPVIAGGGPLIIATIGFTFLGEAMRDILDPKTRTNSQ
ncbi:ABC transporter permease [Roseovarius indicus]|uniref:Peptide ABC transporter permease n=1 Tax=Roseovarius indicus TaxID=540747 RepID=A0A0T5P1S9_9RHOB|nr:ABC transporter permease [Roseovarius indicus]KRS15028.1 peptide ABC transporter permease [Roseovarius indicus]QEW25348.1 putative D,D-dipeptide transport system permease protein DdpC [Roseovarius indicus]SFE21197.1 peptide/nickel transport system permease protein [Roseovarius indicus]